MCIRDRLTSQFTGRLKAKYKDILQVTDNVDSLLQELETIDSNFRELCFNDDLYQLHKLPELVIHQISAEQGEKDILKKDSLINEDSSLILKLSNWSLSISDFITRFTVSTVSSKLFDNLITQFKELEIIPEDSLKSDYRTLALNKCHELQSYLINSIKSSQLDFGLIQWMNLYYLFVPTESHTQYYWDKKMLEQVETLIFNAIFQYDIDTLLNNNTTNEPMTCLLYTSRCV